MSSIYYEKLVRDNIPQIIEQSGKKAIYSKLSKEALKLALKRKLCEEAIEFYQAETKEEKIEELADLIEVVYSIMDANNIAFGDVIDKRRNKADEKGYFFKGYLLHSVEE